MPFRRRADQQIRKFGNCLDCRWILLCPDPEPKAYGTHPTFLDMRINSDLNDSAVVLSITNKNDLDLRRSWLHDTPHIVPVSAPSSAPCQCSHHLFN